MKRISVYDAPVRALSLVLAISAFVVLGCGSDSTQAICETGSALACRCSDGKLGNASCNASGSAFETCDCSGAQPPTTTSSSSTGGSSCKDDLSNIGTADFTIAIDVTTTQTGTVAVANQRGVCSVGEFWDLRLYDGAIDISTDDGTNLADVRSGSVVNDGQRHALKAQRVSGMLSISDNGAVVATMPSASTLGALPAIAIGHDVCLNTDGTQDFVGKLGTVCVTSP